MVPSAPVSKFGDYNWFLSAIRLARLSSIAYSSLFSLSASVKPKESYRSAIQDVRRVLEEWRLLVPVDFRPKEAIQPTRWVSPSIKLVAMQTQYSYYNLIIALERLTLHIDPDESVSREQSKRNLLSAARAVIELIQFIDIEPYMPILSVQLTFLEYLMHMRLDADGFFCLSMAGIMPLSALFVVFDFVIHNPIHSETERNLLLLDQVAGYFTLLDHASRGTLPGSIMSEFVGIARQYVAQVRQKEPTATSRHTIIPESNGLNFKMPNEEEEHLTNWPTDMNHGTHYSVCKTNHPLQEREHSQILPIMLTQQNRLLQRNHTPNHHTLPTKQQQLLTTYPPPLQPPVPPP